MRLCPTCGAKIDNDAAFCEDCGVKVFHGTESARTVASSTHRTRGKDLHCPECGEINLSPIVESTNNGGVAFSSPITRRTGVTSYSSDTTHRNYWLCQNCGSKFRNLQNLREEIVSESKKMKLCMMFGLVMAAVSLLCGLMAIADKLMALFLIPSMVISLTAGILFLCIWFSTRNKIVKMVEEKKYLEGNCFGKF